MFRRYMSPEPDPTGGDPAPTPDPTGDPVPDPTRGDTSWRDGLSQESRDDPTIGRYENVEDLAKGLITAQRSLGNKVGVPSKASTPEEWATFWDATGRPAEINGYESPQDLPEGTELDVGQTEAFFKHAHSIGLTKQQAAHLMRFEVGRQGEAMTAHEAAMDKYRQESITTLKGEFGQAYDERIALAKNAVAQLGGEPLQTYLTSTGMGDSPEMVRAWAKVGEILAQDAVIGQGRQEFTQTPEQAQREIDKLNGDEEFNKAYMKKNHPGHKEAVAKMNELQALASPEVKEPVVIGHVG